MTTRNHEDPQAVVLADVLSTAGFHVSMFRREVWDALGGFDEELEHYSEADFWARAIESGFEGDVLAEPMFQGHRLPPDNGDGLSRLDSELRVMERFFRKHVAAGNTNDLVLAKERDLVDERRRFEQLCDRKGRLEDQLRSLQASIDQIAAELRLVGRGRVEFGDFRRASPISPLWGVDRGIPLDRYYIHRFLEQCRTDIRGRVLEIKDAGYTRWFGSDQVSRSDVLDINAANTNATILADLTKAPAIVDDTYDCFILTQTLGVVYDVGAAIAEAYRILKPEGVLLCTLPAVGRISCEEGLDGDYWRFTEASVRRLFAEVFPVDAFEVTGYGNVLACTAFLYGLAPDELTPAELDCVDPYFPVVYTVRAVKRADNRSANSSPVQS